MFELEYLIAGIILIALIVYTLSGGADFGGGVWDLFAFGKRKEAQRSLISSAIAPIWEANHVWLIVIIVLLFVCFPLAYATISTALHIPLTIMLLGIVLRGSAFIFRSHDEAYHKSQRVWGLVFAISSVITPIMIGVCLGAISTGTIRVDPLSHIVQTDFISDWLGLFPFVNGFFVLALCAYLSALYLIFDAGDKELRRDFRIRAIASLIILDLIGAYYLGLSETQAPEIYQGILDSPWSPELPIIVVGLSLVSLISLFLHFDVAASAAGMAQAVLMILGFGMALFPYLVVPDITILDAAATEAILKPVLIALGIGFIALIPSFGYLYYVFKFKKNPSINH